ncbi:ATP-binding protein [Helcococcus bovis]|uniref:ATP-binding protein n=1 Tax=Helcococcus bovis TaxID=3153252 RepID=UPI0038BDDA11
MKTVQEILEDRRRQNEINLENRIDEVRKKVPRIIEISNEIKIKNIQRINNLIEKKSSDDISKEISKLISEKNILMEKNNIPKDYLEMKYHCDICHDTGVDGTRICECRKKLEVQKLYKDSEIEEIIREENFDNFNLNLFRKDRQSNENISPYENMRDLKEQFYDYAVNFSRDSVNLFLFGPVGTGKTFMINSIAKEVLDRNFSVVYFSESDLVNLILEYKFAFSNQKSDLLPRINSIYDCDLLIIDDLGSNNINDNTTSAVFEVLNKRIVKKLPVIISSNLDTEDVRAIYDTRIYSRIVGEFYQKYFYGNDVRIKK